MKVSKKCSHKFCWMKNTNNHVEQENIYDNFENCDMGNTFNGEEKKEHKNVNLEIVDYKAQQSPTSRERNIENQLPLLPPLDLNANSYDDQSSNTLNKKLEESPGFNFLPPPPPPLYPLQGNNTIDNIQNLSTITEEQQVILFYNFLYFVSLLIY